MYCGQIVEFASVEQLFEHPVHPYTRHLLNALPEYRDATVQTASGEALIDTMNLPEGCLYHPRCPWADKMCTGEDPGSVEVEPGHLVKCCRTGQTDGKEAS